MTAEQIIEQLDELADAMSAAVDSGKEPSNELSEQYAEWLTTFITEYPSDAIAWLREVYSVSDPVRETARELIDSGVVSERTTFGEAAQILRTGVDGR